MKVKCPECTKWLKSEHLKGFGLCMRLSFKYVGFNNGIKMTHHTDWCGKGERNGTPAKQGA